MPYLITKKALRDINEIWLYTADHWSVEQADRYYNLIFDEIEFVAENFDRARDVGWLREGYGMAKVKSHIIFFRRTRTDEIQVVRVLHERMDLPNRLQD